MSEDFRADARIERDSHLVVRLALCQVRLQEDARWPWLVLVPQRPGLAEIFELTPADRHLLSEETALVAEALQRVTAAEKINIGALGNIVRQLHVHVIARFSGDDNWPGPVWGFGSPRGYDSGERERLSGRIAAALAEARPV